MPQDHIFHSLSRITGQIVLLLFFSSVLFSVASAAEIKALVGGRLIDGFGGVPLSNSVIIIEGDRISAVGQVGSLEVPPEAEVISTEGMSVLPGLWDMHVHLMINGHTDYGHWDETYPSLFESVIMPSSAHQLLLADILSAAG